jgi:hypothetical protein
MNASDLINKLGEWKEKILLGIVLIATLFIAGTHVASKPFPGRATGIDSEVRAAAISASGATTEQAERVLRLLENPSDITPTPVNTARVNLPFYDERDVYVRERPSGWTLTQASYLSLPPIELELPGMTALADFDTPAGPRPDLSRLTGFVPRDGRRVVLSEDDEDGGR